LRATIIPTEENDTGQEGFQEQTTPFRVDKTLIGQHLLSKRLLDKTTLENALRRQDASHLRIGEELIGRGEIRAFDFYRSLADQQGRPFINLRLTPPDITLLRAEDVEFYLQEQCLPWREKNGAIAYVAVDPLKSSKRMSEKFEQPFLFYQTSPLDILWAVQTEFSAHLTCVAQDYLRSRSKESSADQLLSAKQTVVLSVLIALIALSAFAKPQIAFLIFNACAAIAFLALAALRFLSMDVARSRNRKSPVKVTSRSDSKLPLYTIMIPLLREANVLPILVTALQKLDYPPSKLDIKLILEATDQATIEAAKKMRLPGNVELIIVPASLPTTKPKACNYALAFARGELLVVYDAEDIPGPGQLREAVEAFDRGGELLACLQAPLAYYNWTENWLTRHFAIEYAAIFDLLLPTLARFSQPFPLGGTSTHFRTSILRSIGAWDPFNVTEDADLGIRLHEAGYKSDVLSTPTLEEANCQTRSWVRQRSRWLKGWMQTYFVRMRRPRRAIRQLGAMGFLTFQVAIGAFILSALLHPLFYIAIFYAITFDAEQSASLGMAMLFFFNASVLLLGFSATMLAGLAGAYARGLTGLGAHVLTMPLYWLLISFSAYRAVFQLIFEPHVWEKTDHGLSNMTEKQLVTARRDAYKPGFPPK